MSIKFTANNKLKRNIVKLMKLFKIHRVFDVMYISPEIGFNDKVIIKLF